MKNKNTEGKNCAAQHRRTETDTVLCTRTALCAHTEANRSAVCSALQRSAVCNAVPCAAQSVRHYFATAFAAFDKRGEMRDATEHKYS